uniref:DUF4399 domain-containing protein n=1 Tax=uncultured bacterium HF186_25m_18N5 TaxID=662887 RepID=C7FPF7_9BACT|nr:hypothetical protein [uncultured bacterium HF186_25m_18N5]
MKLTLRVIALAAALSLVACENKAPEPAAQAPAAKVEAAQEEPAAPTSLPAPKGAKVFFDNLKNGDEVTSPVTVCIGSEGLELEASGPVNPGKGHHHILVDIPVPDDLSKDIPKDAQNIHLGDGSSCADVTLSPGAHTLRLLFADGSHRPYEPAITASIDIKVVEKKEAPKPAAPAPAKAPAEPTTGKVLLKPNMAPPKAGMAKPQVMLKPGAAPKVILKPNQAPVVVKPAGDKPKVVVKPKQDKPKVVVKPKQAKPKVVVKPKQAKPKVVVKPKQAKPKVVVKPKQAKPKVVIKPKQ